MRLSLLIQDSLDTNNADVILEGDVPIVLCKAIQVGLDVGSPFLPTCSTLT
jgi:hypothetical protein